VAFGDELSRQSLTIAPPLYKLDYDPRPVAIVAQRPEILTVNPGVPPNSLAEIRPCPPHKSL
jgi:hypothetical protein